MEDAPGTEAGNVFVAVSPFSAAYLIDAGDFTFELICVLGRVPGQDREAVMQRWQSIAESIDILE
jgi:hypothetical protein